MQDATVDRLARVLADPKSSREPEESRYSSQEGLLSRLRLAEGWFSFFLLALVVYSTIWSVQAVNWVDHLGLLTPIAGLGLVAGIIAAKQQRLPRLLVHTLVVVFGVFVAFWQTAGADYAGSLSAFLHNVALWFSLAFNGGTSSDDSIFLFFILALGFLLAYTSTWLVYRTRSPWLMLLANAVVLLINLNNVNAGYVIFLVIFLVSALLLLLRFNLYESSVKWKRQGLRCSEDLHWEFMQAGALVSLAILISSWFLPWGYINQAAAQIWNTNPLVATQNIWNRLIAVNGGDNPQNHGSFASTLTLGGNPNLINTPVFRLKTTDGTQYLMSVSYDQYDGSRNWSNSTQQDTANKANTVSYDGSQDLAPVTQTVTVLNPPGEERPYLFGASQIAATGQGTELVSNKSDGEVVSWLRTNGKLAAGDVYSLVSYVSTASLATLRTVPMPAASPTLDPGFTGSVPVTYFSPSVLATYTKLPANLNARIKTLALQITRNASTMYDKVAALETYLRANYTYNASITAPPPGVEATAWFLFNSKNGYCNYFAAAMTLLARELGIPARIAAGYTNGTLDSKTGERDINGTEAHAWTQVYFAGYGWINFEPSASFALFTRPITSSSSSTTGVTGPSATVSPGTGRLGNQLPNENDLSGSAAGGNGATTADQVRLGVGVTLLVMVFLALLGLLYFRFWWRRQFRGLSLPDQIYGRVCLMANWAGLSLKRSQTPYEYMQELLVVAPEEAVTFERLGDIYAREHWADPESEEHPARRGEIGEVSGIWKSLQPRLMAYIVRHPYFLSRWPAGARRVLHHLPFSRTSRGKSTVVVEEEFK